jgi:phosphatidylserine decarboxylase
LTSPAQPEQIPLYNRRHGRMEQEKVYGRRFMDLCYQSRLGRRITGRLLCRQPVSRLYGRVQQHPWTRRQIPGFIAQYGIDLSEAIVPTGGFACFNDFFTRRLKPGARPVDRDPCRLVSPADSRLQVFQLGRETRLNVKGNRWTLAQLLGTADLDPYLRNGLCFCFRLAPSDYHRFGYADDGLQGPVHTVPGPLHSVNPLALQHKEDILATNYRQWCFVQSPCYGTMIQVEVGALIVGSIIQQQPQGGPCRRGAEKGYFQFGGSTVLLILEPGRVRVDPDIQEKSNQGIETLVRYGEGVAIALSPK